MRLLKQAASFAALMIGLAIGLVAIAPVQAFAQNLEIVSIAEPSLVQQLVTAVLPAVGVLISAVLLWGAGMLKARTGIDIEARHREALQSALMNGVLFALQKAGWVSGQEIPKAVLATARSYVESSVPDALKQFGIDPATGQGQAALDRLLTPKLPLATGAVNIVGDALVGRAT